MLSKRILLLFGFLHISGKALARDCYKCNDIVADIVNCAGNNETTFDVTECGENACAKVTVYQYDMKISNAFKFQFILILLNSNVYINVRTNDHVLGSKKLLLFLILRFYVDPAWE